MKIIAQGEKQKTTTAARHRTENVPDGAPDAPGLNNVHVRCRCLLNLGGQRAAPLLGSGSAHVAGRLACTRRRGRRLCANVSPGALTRAKQLCSRMTLKMAVDARRKEVVAKGKGHAREKKPGGDDGDAHAADQSERSPSGGPEQARHPRASVGTTLASPRTGFTSLSFEENMHSVEEKKSQHF